MAPFLDPPPLPRRLPSGPNKYEDEAFVLPALLRFGGEAFVDDGGGLLYRFPALQVQAADARTDDAARRTVVPLEREWEFSAASPGQQLGALALGAFNVVGVIVLSTMLADPISKLALYRQGLGFVLGLLPYLQAYAGAFFAIPLVRALLDARRNAAIEERNDARAQALGALEAAARDGALDAKLAAARRLGARRVVGRGDIVYTTAKGAEQFDAMDAADFDRRLSRQDGIRGGGGDDRRRLEAPRANRVDDVFGRGAARERELERERARLRAEDDGARRGGRRRGGDDDDWDDLRRW